MSRRGLVEDCIGRTDDIFTLDQERRKKLMGWILCLFMLVGSLFRVDTDYFIAAGLFAIAGAIGSANAKTKD